jgi:hypothetical protein
LGLCPADATAALDGPAKFSMQRHETLRT